MLSPSNPKGNASQIKPTNNNNEYKLEISKNSNKENDLLVYSFSSSQGTQLEQPCTLRTSSALHLSMNIYYT